MSHLTRKIIPSTAEFQEALNSAQSSNVYLLFTAAFKEDGNRWCPDCTDADPVLSSAFEEVGKEKEITVLEFPIIRDEYKDVSTHPYRIDERIKLARIPTLVKFANNEKVGELIERDCSDPELVKKFLA